MTRIVLRILNPWLFVLSVILVVALQTSLFQLPLMKTLQPDWVLLAVVWCGLERSFYEGGILTLIFAYLMEIHSAAPQGTFLLTYILVFFLIRIAAHALVLPNRSSLVLLCMGSVAAWKILNLALLGYLGLGTAPLHHFFINLIPSALATGASAWFLLPWLEWFDRKTYKSHRAFHLLDDEIIWDGGSY
ncbi:MAG: rod shape-determining protein MreD [Bdellovibrionales bacterium]|nr:rod shape-determining protein MreD [Bdellovibrionales bacterium]